jgi:hypothetical protein
MTDDTWIEYGSPGTQTLGNKDVEQAIARLEWLWDEAASRAQHDTDRSSDFGGCACSAS